MTVSPYIVAGSLGAISEHCCFSSALDAARATNASRDWTALVHIERAQVSGRMVHWVVDGRYNQCAEYIAGGRP